MTASKHLPRRFLDKEELLRTDESAWAWPVRADADDVEYMSVSEATALRDEAVRLARVECYRDAARKVRFYSPGDPLEIVFDALASQTKGPAAPGSEVAK